MTLLARSSARHLVRHRAQLGLSLLGVALGVAIVVGIDIAIESSRAAFLVSAETVSGRATHQIVSDVGAVDETLFPEIRVGLGVREAAPVVEGYALSPALPGTTLRVLGIDLFSEAPFRPYGAGAAPGTGAGLDVASFLTTRGATVLSEATARDAGVSVGDSLTVLIGGEMWELPIVGTLPGGDELTTEGLRGVLLLDIASAQEVLGLEGRLSRIDLRIASGEEGDAVLARIVSDLPPGVRITPVGTRTEAMAGMIEAFDLNLTALSLLGLIFGMFLIYNTMTFSVVQRRNLIGRLRALGVTRSEIVRVVLSEALWLGVVGAVLGAAIGAVLGRGLVRLVTRTINDLYFAVSVEQVAIDPWVLIKGAAIGLVATLLAAVPPTLEAASVPPRIATLRSTLEERARRIVPQAALWGLVSGALGCGLLAVPSRSLVLSFTALFFVILGLSLLTPLGTVGLTALLRRPIVWAGGILGAMAARGVVTTLSRTAPAIAALVVAVSVTVGLGTMIGSFRSTLIRWLDGTLQADVYVSLPGPQASAASGTLWPELIDEFTAHPAVVGHSTYRGLDVLSAEGAYRLVALEQDPRGERAFDFIDEARAGALEAFRTGEGALVSEPYAYRRGVGVGDSVRLSTPSGSRSVPVAGVFYDYASDQGVVMIARSLYDEWYRDPGVTSLGLFLADGAESEEVVLDLEALVPEGRVVLIRSNDTLRSASLQVFDRTFRVTGVLRLLAFIVAFVGVVSALMAVELERAKEIGLLRTAGLTPGQLWRLVSTQTGLIGILAGIMAIPVGIVLSVVMIYVVNKRSFGWTLQMDLSAVVLGQAVAIALVSALLAGLYPAWRMSRTPPATALRSQ